MSYTYQKDELVISGWENGIATSPHKGIANMQAVNISTETGEAMCSYNRTKQSQTGTSGTLTQVNTNTVSITGITLLVGQVITITNAGTTGLSGSYYYISTGKLVSGSSAPNDPTTATIVTGITAGSATFSITYPLGQPIQSATEYYYDTSNNPQYRYYILDSTGVIWCHDTATIGGGLDTPIWFFAGSVGNALSGLAVYNGWLVAVSGYTVIWKPTTCLGNAFTASSAAGTVSSLTTHVSFVGHQGKLYISDGSFIASMFASTSLITGAANIQSFSSYTAVTTTGTVTAILQGSFPTLGAGSTTRIPAVFFSAGTKPAAITVGTVYYILDLGSGLFEVYAAASGGSAINIAAGAVGKQYFNTFYPISSGGQTLQTFTAQRLNLPAYEVVQCMAELGNIMVIGGKTNAIYQWNQVSALPGDFILLPENNSVKIITVNNMGYVFGGQKGNIYITNGSTSSLVLNVPDYCAGVPGTPATYIEPYFTWGDAMYMRGRVWFSILDQTATKTGNCGGIWSFVPTQNFFVGQDTGMGLRVENRSSYGTYSGYATVLLASQVQTVIGPQYWSGWNSNINSATYGIDFSDTIPTTPFVIETDAIPTGTLLGQQKKTFQNIEYKLSSPLASGETVAISYRQNITDAWTSCGTATTESATNLAGYFTVNFENGQWLQLQITGTPLASSSSSFIRLKEIRVR